jgi:hypothetical protein
MFVNMIQFNSQFQPARKKPTKGKPAPPVDPLLRVVKQKNLPFLSDYR